MDKEREAAVRQLASTLRWAQTQADALGLVLPKMNSLDGLALYVDQLPNLERGGDKDDDHNNT